MCTPTIYKTMQLVLLITNKTVTQWVMFFFMTFKLAYNLVIGIYKYIYISLYIHTYTGNAKALRGLHFSTEAEIKP